MITWKYSPPRGTYTKTALLPAAVTAHGEVSERRTRSESTWA